MDQRTLSPSKKYLTAEWYWQWRSHHNKWSRQWSNPCSWWAWDYAHLHRDTEWYWQEESHHHKQRSHGWSLYSFTYLERLFLPSHAASTRIRASLSDARQTKQTKIVLQSLRKLNCHWNHSPKKQAMTCMLNLNRMTACYNKYWNSMQSSNRIV